MSGEIPTEPAHDELRVVADALRTLVRGWNARNRDLRRELAFAYLENAILGGAWPGARFAALRQLILKAPERLEQRRSDESVELPSDRIVGCLSTLALLPEWFREYPSFLWEPDIYTVLADLLAPPSDVAPSGTAASDRRSSDGGPRAKRRAKRSPPPATAPTEVSWEEAARRALQHIKKQPFPGLTTLAKLCGCSKSTMHKAVKRNGQLSVAQHKYEEEKLAKRRVRTVSLGDGQTTVPSSRSRPARRTAAFMDVVDELSDADIRARFDDLVRRAPDAAGRKELLRLSFEQQRALVEFHLQHPEFDGDERVRER